MKAKLEESTVHFRGVILEAENEEESEVLKDIWNNGGRPVAFSRAARGTWATVTLAPTPESAKR